MGTCQRTNGTAVIARYFDNGAVAPDQVVLRRGMPTSPPDTTQAELIAELDDLLGTLSDERLRLRLDLDRFLQSVTLLTVRATAELS